MVSLNGNDLTIEQVCAVARGQEKVEISATAIGAMQRSRASRGKACCGRCSGIRSKYGRRAAGRCARPDGRPGSASTQCCAIACGGRGRSSAHRRGAGDDADPRQRAGQRILGDSDGGGGAAVRSAERGRYAGGSFAWQRGRERRSGSAGAHGAGADGRGRSRISRRAYARRRSAATRGDRRDRARFERRNFAAERHAGDARRRRASNWSRRKCWRRRPTW